MNQSKVRRSETCPCGSNRKYKKCCEPLTGPLKHQRDEDNRILVRKSEGQTLELLIRMSIDLMGEEFFEDARNKYSSMYDEVTFPSEQMTERVIDEYDPYLYCFHIYLAFKHRFFVDKHKDSVTLGELLLCEHSKFLSQNQIDFINATKNASYRYLTVVDSIDSAYVELMDIETGEKFTVRDLGLAESKLSGNIILAVLFKLYGAHYLLGTFPRSLPGDWATKLIKNKKDFCGQFDKITSNFQTDFNESPEIKNLFIQRIPYYESILELNNTYKSTSRVRNTDKEVLAPLVIEYELFLEPNVAKEKLLKKSKQLKAINNADSTDLIWYGRNPKTDITGEPYVRGIVKIYPNKLILEVNSYERAEKLSTHVENILKNRIDYLEEREGYLEPISKLDDLSSCDEPEELPADLIAELQNKMDAYYVKWIDEKIPALNNKTPRQASKDPKMLPALEALLLELERRSSLHGPDVVTANVDLIRARLFGTEN